MWLSIVCISLAFQSQIDILNKNFLLFNNLETQEINILPVLTNILSKLVKEKTYSLNDK